MSLHAEYDLKNPEFTIPPRGNRLKNMGYRRLNPIQFILIGTVNFLTFILGTYHFTHQGRVSGTTELITTVLLATALLLPHETRRHFRRFSALQILLIGIVDFFALLFGIYHLSTPDGLRSGITELGSFTLLTIAIFIEDR